MKKALLLVLAGVTLGFLAWDIGALGAREEAAKGQRTGTYVPPALQPYVHPETALTVVHFWATWCPPCMVEMPNLLANLPNLPDGVALVMVSLDAPAPQAFYAANKLEDTAQVRWVDDPSRTLAQAVLPRIKLPTTLIVRASPSEVIQQIDGPLVWQPLLETLGKLGTR